MATILLTQCGWVFLSQVVSNPSANCYVRIKGLVFHECGGHEYHWRAERKIINSCICFQVAIEQQ